jgi:hypothetical protein
LQRAITHLPLNPVERFVLLQRQDREAVTALPDWSVRNFRSLRKLLNEDLLLGMKPGVVPKPFSSRLRRAE